ncbi:uncharacterized protein LAESUDRAFT_765496 [Laetiporus sulphureus 93-53]|uniref:Uncharacterized protein n=1 Tax=Laetiporus sulphureus 93-53 TaxID=1314785 RepID=A0A165AQN9_9APHY|nr:uncharacterized protein LAESUDRAFT_765496 [Laetiporus sulphureus 93-53]KZS99467.1 hypothetical protein LAESUDRAFT_765496 [Laetiporus sulphureus 93-53]
MSEFQDVHILQELTYQAELEQVEPISLAMTPLSARELLKAQAQQREQKLLKIDGSYIGRFVVNAGSSIDICATILLILEINL